MTKCFFVSDLHGKQYRYENLFAQIKLQKPEVIFLGGDLYPHGGFNFSQKMYQGHTFFDYFRNNIIKLKDGSSFPRIFLILGNDDFRSEESLFFEGEEEGLWTYIHGKTVLLDEYTVSGLSYVPPTPFQLKDWERYDISQYVDPGSISPLEGMRTFPVEEDSIKYMTIQRELEEKFSFTDVRKSVFLFHSPPYQTMLDRAALDGKYYDHAPLDVHVGSIAIMKFIEERQPYLTLHGHIHESSTLTGSWSQKIGSTRAMNAAYEGEALSLISFDLASPQNAVRKLYFKQ